MAPILHSELCAPGAGMELSVVRARMQAEFEHAQRQKLAIVLVRADVEALERTPFRERRETVLRAVVDLLAALPRGGELIAVREDDGVLALLPGTPQEAAELMLGLWIDGARKLSLPGEAKGVRVSLSVGLACAPSGSAFQFETLQRVALDGLAVAKGNGGECFVHTELYGLYQKKLDRERAQVESAARDASGSADAGGGASDARASDAASARHDATPMRSGSMGEASIDSNASTRSSTADRAARAEIERILAKHRPAIPAELPSVESPSSAVVRAPAIAPDRTQDTLKELLAALDEKHRTEVDLLERRIAKLTRTLEDTEEKLAHVDELHAVDGGVASAYRDVQGLGLGERQRELKLDLLTQILRANLALRDGLREAR